MTSTAKLVVAALFFALALAVVTARSVSSYSYPGSGDEYGGMGDYRAIVYYPAVAMRAGINPYDSDAFSAIYQDGIFQAYPPLTLLVYQPFAALPLVWAETSYFIVCLAMTLLLAWLLAGLIDARPTVTWVLTLAAVILLSRPGQQTMINGQVTLQALIGIVLVLRYASTRPWLGAIGMLLATFKPTFGLPLIALMLARGNYQALWRGLLIVVPANIAVLVYIAGFSGGIGEFFEALAANVTSHGEHPNTSLATSYSRVDGVFFVSRLSGWLPGFGAQLAVAFAILLVGMAAVKSVGYNHDDDRCTELANILICLSTALFFYHQPYDLMILFVVLLIVAAGRDRSRDLIGRSRRYVLMLLVVAPLFNFAATATGLRLLDPGETMWELITMFNATALVVSFCLCLYLAYLARKEMLAQYAKTSELAHEVKGRGQY